MIRKNVIISTMTSTEVDNVNGSVIDGHPTMVDMQNQIIALTKLMNQLLNSQQSKDITMTQPVIQQAQTENCCQTCIKCIDARQKLCCPVYTPSERGFSCCGFSAHFLPLTSSLVGNCGNEDDKDDDQENYQFSWCSCCGHTIMLIPTLVFDILYNPTSWVIHCCPACD